jgi:hypothetical protein
MLFGVNLKIRQRFRKTTRAVAILWNVICAITFHTIWTIRNDKKHRDIDPPTPMVLIDRIVRSTKSHLRSIHRNHPEDELLLIDLTIVAATLKLTDS